MSRLAETTVQVAALDFLEKKYKKKARRNRIFAQTEVRTRKKYGGKRADGLLVFRNWWWGTYVISLEAKSFKTLPAMKPKRDNRLYILNSIRAGLIICILTGAFFALYKMEDGFLQFLLPINAFGIGGLLYAYLTRKHFGHKTVDVIKQVRQYPGNEKWLAFSQDSLNAISVEKLKNLEIICKHQGIGILVVKNKNKVEELVRAKYHTKWFRDHLVYYSIEKDIRKAIR